MRACVCARAGSGCLWPLWPLGPAPPTWTPPPPIESCGDVHPHPGPDPGQAADKGDCQGLGLSVVSVNVTAMRRHHEQLLPLGGADVLCLQETRLTAPAQRAMTSLARGAQWQCFWGCPQDSRTGGIWDPPPGGTGILVKAGWPARRAEIREDDQLAQRLWHSGRCVHVHICLGSGAVALNVMCVYGVSSNPALNAQLWSQLLEYRARLGVAPCLIFADANFDFDVHTAYPKDVLAAVLQGDMIDLDYLHSAAAGVPTCCAYEASSGSKTRIDGALADARRASTLTGV